MENERNKIFVKDIQTGQVLLECKLNETERAWKFAAQMEEMGLDVKVMIPTLGDTLSSSLGLTSEQLAQYKESLEEEMESHEGSCCFKNEQN